MKALLLTAVVAMLAGCGAWYKDGYIYPKAVADEAECRDKAARDSRVAGVFVVCMREKGYRYRLN